ncbi:hypothetical protein F0562_026557 [Nyssa sinensis]|uniref:Glucose-methanol-choline oxidoreductase N-terminal domain-containing protein n=1 Tax=Nyssa sinensis TaxID=561372 RepID=A0A5J5B9D3_9ASTE|nr:hypothetical protein F0562_026557 [Nyssa sinensis]
MVHQTLYPQAGVILEKIRGPFSSGDLKLRTTDPGDNPDVSFNYFKDRRDLWRCVQGMKTIIKVAESKSFSEFRFANQSVQALIDIMINTPVNMRPKHANASSSLEQFCIDTVMTLWHYHGGCQVGRVVDRDYKVLGVDALRVVDGSTFYDSPGTNPQATVLMLGRVLGVDGLRVIDGSTFHDSPGTNPQVTVMMLGRRRWVHGYGVLLVLLLLAGILFFHAPNYSFLRDATSAPPVVYFDYIIIGGGTAGCALAATLSQGANVLLLERGDSPYSNPNISNIRGFASTLQDAAPLSASQSFISTDGVFNHRGRVLGGGTALNAGYYTRASAAYVNQVGWDHKLVNESYEWVEKKMVFWPSVLQWQSAVRDGLLEAGVFPYNGFTYDHLYGTKVGGTIFDQQGDRHTAADLLEYAVPRRITVYLNATVHRILFRKNAVFVA